jgi:type II secretory pathway pseudopilin PulG
MTLIETLAVIVIISLVAGATIVNLSAASARAELRCTMATIRDMDARARLMGRSGNSVVLTPTEQRDGLLLVTERENELLSTVPMPSGVRVRLQIDGGEAAVQFDAVGRSVDYELLLEQQDSVRILRVCGLTGLIREAEEGP